MSNKKNYPKVNLVSAYVKLIVYSVLKIGALRLDA